MKGVDDLQLLCGASLSLDANILLKQPKLGQIIDYGESRYRQIIGTWTTTPSMMISVLADMGVDWESLSEFELFALYLRNGLTDSDSEFLFEGLRLNEYKPEKNEDGKLILKSVVNGHVLDGDMYFQVAEFLRRLHGAKHIVRKAGNAMTKRRMIDEDRQQRILDAAERRDTDSHLLPIISALVNSPGFKYNLEGIRDLTYYALVESLKRISAMRQSDALMNGAYCGMADLSKVPKSDFDWLRDLSKDG